MSVTKHGAADGSMPRIDGEAKVRGRAPFAYEHDDDAGPLYLFPVQATIAAGRVTRIETTAAAAAPGVFTVLTHENAPRVANTDDKEWSVLQSADIGFRGQFIAAVLAETPEQARHAASLVVAGYDQYDHNADFRADSQTAGDMYIPDIVNGGGPPDTSKGDVDAALDGATAVVDETYSTPFEFNNPLEPHTAVARWNAGTLTIYDSTQGVHPARHVLATVFGLEPERLRVISPFVGGGFGSKGTPHAGEVLAALAAMVTDGRPVKYPLTRQQMFQLAGYREPTSQHIRLAADADGKLLGIADDVTEATSRIKEFAEQTAVPARMMYAADQMRTTHRLHPLDIPVPSWFRAPGECPGMFGLETAMDELAHTCNIDPIELRRRNDTQTDPMTGKPFSSRHLIECLDVGAARFGWDRRGAPGTRRDGAWRIGMGVAASTYPFVRIPGSVARIGYRADGKYDVGIGAADLGTGTWTTLTQIAAEALGISEDFVRLDIGDTNQPNATIAGGSSGTASWGGAIMAAAGEFFEKYGSEPEPGDEAEAEAGPLFEAGDYSLHSFGAQFAEVKIHELTGEVRVDRLFGVFSVGRVINARTARSQFIGGMTMGLGMALHENGVMDPRFGHIVNHDLAGYHIPSAADVGDIEAVWLDEVDEHAGALGARGIGEIGIVGTAAAIANATYNATGIRVRDLPLTLDKFLR